ncbi:MAG TPA: hypothetical protein VM639_24420 [Dongiaceae bacterium]|nr:hypothetical protein [Dongiaceae bacterium]
MKRDTRNAVAHALTWGGLAQFVILAAGLGVYIAWSWVLAW